MIGLSIWLLLLVLNIQGGLESWRFSNNDSKPGKRDEFMNTSFTHAQGNIHRKPKALKSQLQSSFRKPPEILAPRGGRHFHLFYLLRSIIKKILPKSRDIEYPPTQVFVLPEDRCNEEEYGSPHECRCPSDGHQNPGCHASSRHQSQVE